MSALPTRTSLPPGFRHAARAVVIGASAGGIDALLALLPALPAGYPLPVIVVLHLPPDRDSILPELFAPRCALPVKEATDKAPVAPGVVYFAPAGYHLLVEGDATFSLSCDAPVQYSRPSIDVLMESAADAYGSHLVAILLTGANDDGAHGMQYAARAGALTVAQDPARSLHPAMPSAAVALASPAFVLGLEDIGALMAQLELSP